MPDDETSVVDRGRSRHWPPKNVKDTVAWDQYWQNQVDDKIAGFHDIFLRDEALVRFMIAFGGQTVLCAGNGLSIEPYVLAYAGFQVTAVDLSVWATQLQQNWRPRPKFLKNHLYGRISFRSILLYSSFRRKLRSAGWLIRDVNKHLLDPLKRKGGTLKFLAGDLLDAECCPGPFDAIIERRMVQLYSDPERNQILERLTARLAPRGIFVSHCHMGWWHPGEPRTHLFAEWFYQHGFNVNPRSDCAEIMKTPGQIAVLYVTTG